MKRDQDGQANNNRREFLGMGVAATFAALTGVSSKACAKKTEVAGRESPPEVLRVLLVG